MTPSEFFVGLDGTPTLRNRLPARVIASLLLSLIVVLLLLAWMLSLSRGLERADEATKTISDLRMRANQIAIELIRPISGGHVGFEQVLARQDQDLAWLAERDASASSDASMMHQQIKMMTTLWAQRARPAVDQARETGRTNAYLVTLSEFITQANRLAAMIERDNDSKRIRVRLLQGSIAAMGSVGTGLSIYLLYVWIILPMLRLREGLRRLTAGQFHTRLTVKTRDEFGVLAQGFNQMAAKLERLYQELEAGVQTRTAALEKQNREIALLYAVTAFLSLPNDGEAICRGFLKRVIDAFGAQGGTVRLRQTLDDADQTMIAENMTGDASDVILSEGQVYRDDDTAANMITFDIVARETVSGTFALYVDSGRRLQDSEVQLLKTLGQHLGSALKTRRLEAKARQLAVIRERSLVAQGLHDSIAQSLNFLKLQLQLLDDAMQRKDNNDMQQIVPLLRAGVDESYQDVRELLVNFRTKLDQVDLPMAIEDTIRRFRRQTGTTVDLEMQYQSGRVLSPEQQLQVLFILQEALSNVRKHAQADHVRVVLRNAHDFEMDVIDNGVGYCVDALHHQDENHVGLHIMRERADRLHATLQMISRPDAGTTVRLRLPHTARSVT